MTHPPTASKGRRAGVALAVAFSVMLCAARGAAAQSTPATTAAPSTSSTVPSVQRDPGSAGANATQQAPTTSPSPRASAAPTALANSAASTPAALKSAAAPGMLAAASQAASTGPYGVGLIDGCQWATWVTQCQNLGVYGNGNSFDNAACGQPNGCTFGPEFQCTELAQRYAYYALGEPAQWNGYGGANGAAYQMWNAGPALPKPLIQEPQGGNAPPERGDVLIFGQGWLGSYWDGNGHVAVISAVGSDYVDIVQENGTASGMDRLALSGTTVIVNGYTPVIGWLHPGVSSSSGVSRLAMAAGPGQQVVFWRGADNHLREVWLAGSTWNGPADLTATWNNVAPLASAPSVIFSPTGEQTVYWRTASGHLWQASYAGQWSTPVDLSAHWTSDQLLLSAPSAARAPDGQQVVFWQGATGDLWETWLVAGTWYGPADVSWAWNRTAALNSPPSAIVSPDGRQLVYWQTSDGHMWQTWYSAGWQTPIDLTRGWNGQGLLASAPSAAVGPNGDQVVFWRGTDNRLWEGLYNGTSWSGPALWDKLGQITLTPIGAITADGTRVAYWQTKDGHLATATWNGSWNGPADLSATWPPAARLGSAPTVAHTPDGGTQLTFWRGNDGHLWEAWYTGVWNGPVDMTSQWRLNASLASAPSVAVTADGSTQLVFWQGTDGHLWEAWYTGTWNGPVDWTAQWHGAGPMGSAPTVVVSPDGRQQTVFWRGTEGHLWEAWFAGSWNGPVDWSGTWGNAPPLASAPSAALTADGSQQTVFWQDSAGHLQEAWYSGGWHGPVDWSAGWDPAARLNSAPSVLIEPGGDQAIFWQGVNGHLWETWWGGARSAALDWSAVGNVTSSLRSAPAAMTTGGELMAFWRDAGGHLIEAWRADPWTPAVVATIGVLS